jgi:RNA polymerase sigma-70 factor (ECF subfamily)
VREPLFEHVRRILGDSFTAEDVLQETLYTISRRLPSLRDPQWFRAWAYRIATRQALRRGKRERFWALAGGDEALASIESVDEAPRIEPETLAALHDAIAAVPPASQLVIRMHYLDELSLPEIAEALEIPIGTVKSRLAYGLGVLRVSLVEVRAEMEPR